MAQSQVDLSKQLKKPRLLNIPARPREQSSEQNSIFSTRSSYDRSNKSSISRGEFTFRNSDVSRICSECFSLKNQLNDLQKLNLALQEKHESSKKYLKQMTSLLDIKANRLREEETILKAEKEAFFVQREEFQRKSEKFSNKVQNQLKDLERSRKESEEKMKKLENFEKGLKNDKKMIKNQIKDKMMEKFALRETIILRSQQELVSKEENFRLKYLEKNLSLAKREERLNELEDRIKLMDNEKPEKDPAGFKLEVRGKKQGISSQQFEEIIQGLELEKRNLADEIKKLQAENHEKKELLSKLSEDLALKPEIQSPKNLDFSAIFKLESELTQKLQLLLEKEKEIQLKENSLLSFASSLESKESSLKSLDHSLSQLSQTLNAQKLELEALSSNLNKQGIIQTLKSSEIETYFEVLSSHQSDLIKRSEKHSETEYLMKHVQTLLEKKKILLATKESSLNHLACKF